MLLIRGVGSEAHARQIEQGIVGCRDVASILLQGIGETGYLKSDYHERLLQQTLFGIQGRIPELYNLSSVWMRLLRIALDPLLAGSFLTYFHIYDPKITERWLEECWGDDSHFLFIEPSFELDEYSCISGSNYCGAPITYVQSIEDISPRDTMLNNPSFLTLLNSEIDSDTPDDVATQYHIDVLSLLTPLFNRIQERKFDSSESEFRILARDPRTLSSTGLHLQNTIDLKIECEGGIYTLRKTLGDTSPNILFDENGIPVDLLEVAWKESRPKILSHFKELNITDTVSRYGYLGDKASCMSFLKEYRKGLFAPKWFCENSLEEPIPESRRIRNVLFEPSVDDAKAYQGANVISPRGKGSFSAFGAGFKECNFPNPLELGLMDPHSSFTSALKFIIGTDFPDDQSLFSQDYSREFLHSSLDPWLPIDLVKHYTSEDLSHSIKNVADGVIPLTEPSKFAAFDSLFNLPRIRKRLKKNITYEGTLRSLDKTSIEMKSLLSPEEYDRVIAEAKSLALKDFDVRKPQKIATIINQLPSGYERLLRSVRCALFDEYDEKTIHDSIASSDGLFAIYRLDPDVVSCMCAKSNKCDGCLALTLSPTTHAERIDVSKYSFAITPQLIWNEEALSAAYAICLTAINKPVDTSDLSWKLSCFVCPKLKATDNMFIKLSPTRIIYGQKMDLKYRDMLEELAEKNPHIQVDF